VYTWAPRESEKDAPHYANVIFMNGYGEQAARYQHVADQHYNPLGMKVYALDHFGHGEDPQQKGFGGLNKVPFEQLVNDAVALCRHVAAEHPDMPFIVHGHSMGGMLAILTTLQVQYDALYRASIFCASAIRVNGQGIVPKNCANWRFFRTIAATLAILTNGSMPNPGATPKMCTSVQAVWDYCEANAPRAYGGMVCVGWGVVFMRAGDKCIAQLANLKAPFMCFHGLADSVIPPRASEILMEKSGTSEGMKKMHTYAGYKHEIMNEECKDDVLKTMVEYANKMCKEETKQKF
jgi:alpha-beta hydrolase superfamily lysophospholipase